MKKARIASYDYFQKLHDFTGDDKLKPGLFNSFRHIYSFATALIDKVGAWTGKIGLDKIAYQNPDDTERFFSSLKSGRGLFVLCSHLGNIELLRALSAPAGITVNAFVDTRLTKKFNNFIKKNNPDAGLNLYSSLDIGVATAFLIKDRLDMGEIAVMAADRALNRKNTVSLPFLGSQMLFAKGAFRFLRAMECDFCFLAACQNPQGHYDLYLKYFDAKEAGHAGNNYAEWLQELVLKYPYQWYNFL